MKRIAIFGAVVLGLVLSGCSGAEKQPIVSSYEVALNVTDGEVRLLDVREGLAHLEATCDVDGDAVCGVAAAQWCETTPSVYDMQRYMTGASGDVRTVWLASCRPPIY